MKPKASTLVAGVALFCALGASVSRAQDLILAGADSPGSDSAPAVVLPAAGGPALPNLPALLPRMTPELALSTYQDRSGRQLADLGSYTDTTVIEAQLPSSRQKGKFELERTYSAPRSLAFRALHFVGDGFVKTNVIVRWLQSEVDRAQKGDGAATALNDANYKFSFKGADELDGHQVYVYQVKPRRKAQGLFKGRVLIDARSGSIRRAEGTLVKSPSFFLKKIEFVQDYGDFGGFSLPVRLHSVVQTRLVGPTILDVLHSDYRPKSLAEMHTGGVAAVAASATN